MLRILPRTWPIGCVWQRRAVLTLNAATFSHILEAAPSRTESAYADDPLARLTGVQKGRVLQIVSRHAMAAMFPSSVLSEAPAGRRCNGSRRSTHQSVHDFMCDGHNVECKASSMAWNRSSRRWTARWQHVKFHQVAGTIPYLLLALHSPGTVDVLLHDHSFSISRQGVRTSTDGHSINAVASKRLLCPKQACQNMLRKMVEAPGSCLKLSSWETSGSLVSGLICEEFARECAKVASHFYRGVPLADKSECSRGLCLQKVALEVDRIMHPHCSFTSDFGETGVLGRKPLQGRGRGHADWLRDLVRVEFKSSTLLWDPSLCRWSVRFQSIKLSSAFGPAAFDELWLGLHSPFGVHILKHVGSFGVSSAGTRTHTDGHSVQAYGPVKQEDPKVALEAILAKFHAASCDLLAVITW